MKRFSEQFHTKSKSVSMTQAEKQELRERLVSYMEYHPLPAELKTVKKSTAAKTPVLNEAFKTVSLPFTLIFKSSAVAAALVMVVVPFMAEQSVPGDTLYAVKVQFNEEVRGTLTFDSYEKVEWETQRVNRRIAEARLLESEGRLTDEVEAEVAQAVRTHTQNAQREIENLREFDAEEATIASIEFDSNLEAQAASFKEDDVEGQSDETVVAMRSLERAVKSENLIAAAVDESRALNVQPTASTTPSFAKLSARVEQNTTRMYELSDKLESLNPKTKTDVARRIEDIERSVEEAIVESTNNEQVARDILVDVLKRTQKLIVFMTDLEVSDTVDIEELVPVVLTDSEEIEKITAYKAELTSQHEAIVTALEAIDVEEDADIIEKVETGLNTITARLEQIEEAESFDEIKQYAEEAIELANDLLQMLEQTTVPEVVLPEEEVESQATSTIEATSSEPVQIQEPVTEESTTTSSTTAVVSTTTVDAE
jgi:hypothetical protein